MPEMPEWVRLWTWMRFLCDPPDSTPLPQQDHPDPMSQERYEELLSEWKKIGSPALASTNQIMAAMAGRTNPDDLEL